MSDHQPPLRLTSADEARSLLLRFGALSDELIALDDADGRVLAADLVADADLPQWPRSTMDGFAVRASDTPAQATLRIVGRVRVGEVWPRPLGAHEAVAVATGGALPAGADAVVMVERARRDGDLLTPNLALAAGDNVMRSGDDLARGALIAARGNAVRVADLAALAALGVSGVRVHRRPRVGLISTGNEVVARSPGPGQVRDVNAVTLAALVRRAGGVPTHAGVIGDDATLLAERLAALAAGSDAVLVTGGSSIGAHDVTARALLAAGATIDCHGLDIRPGKPTILARLDGKPVIGLPGVPVSALLVYDAFVRPLLRRLAGHRDADTWPSRRAGRLARRILSPLGREDYVRARFIGQDVEPLPSGNSLGALLAADGVVIVPADRDGLAAGDLVEVLQGDVHS